MEILTPIPDPYTTLGISHDADGAAIKKAYRKLVMTCHPDRVADESKKAEATAKFQRVQGAYELLTDSKRKRNYDEGL